MNRELFEKVYRQIQAKPEALEMSSWETTGRLASRLYGCGTTRCIAGWGIYFSTGQDVFDPTGVVLHEATVALAQERGIETSQTAGFVVSELAVALFDIPKRVADWLFHTYSGYATEFVKLVALGHEEDALRFMERVG